MARFTPVHIEDEDDDEDENTIFGSNQHFSSRRKNTVPASQQQPYVKGHVRSDSKNTSTRSTSDCYELTPYSRDRQASGDNPTSTSTSFPCTMPIHFPTTIIRNRQESYNLLNNEGCDGTNNRSMSQSHPLYFYNPYSHCGFSEPMVRSVLIQDTQSKLPTTKRRFRWMMHSVIIAIFSIIVHRYIPPPPSSNKNIVSWRDYYSHGLMSSLTDIMSLLCYVVLGFTKNAYQDIRDNDWNFFHLIHNQPFLLVPSWLSPYLTQSSVYSNKGRYCQLHLPWYDFSHQPTHSIINRGQPSHVTLVSVPNTEDYLLRYILGQHKAMKAIARTLDAWYDHKDPIQHSQRTSRHQGRPLILLLAGSEGVGKTETAKVIAKMFFGHCDMEPNDTWKGYPTNRVLELHGIDYSIQGDEMYSPYDADTMHQDHHVRDFIQTISKHIDQSQKQGNVIIINNIEEMSPIFTTRLGTWIQRSQDKIIPRDSRSGAVLSSLHNTVFIFTSELGSDKIFHFIRRFGGIQDIPIRELQNAMKEDMREYFSQHIVPTIIPYFPLTPKDVENILKQNIVNLSLRYEGIYWKRLELHETASQHFSGFSFLEYLEFAFLSQSTSPFIFAKRGVHGLSDGVFLQTVNALVTRGFFRRADEVVLLEYSAHRDELVISWCNDSTDTHTCTETWRNRLE